MWFATVEGLSRFDGYRFTNYGLEIGLPRAFVIDLIETRNREYLVSTPDGVCHMPPGGARCETIVPDDPEDRFVGLLFEDRDGSVWVGTRRRLYQLGTHRGRMVLESLDLAPEPGTVNDMIQDRSGALWMAADNGLYRRTPGGTFVRFDERSGFPAGHHILAVAEDASGRIWAGSAGDGLYKLVAGPVPGRNVIERVYTNRDGLAVKWVQQLLRTRDGRLLVGSGNEVLDWTDVPRLGARVLLHAPDEISSLFEDRERGLWVAVRGHGAGRIPNSGFTSFTAADGLKADKIDAILESQTGELCVLTKIEQGGRVVKAIAHIEGDRVRMVYPAFPKNTRYYGWGCCQIGFQDHAGEWWLAGGEGLYRFPSVTHIEELARTPPKAIYGTRDGLLGDNIFRIYEDTRGDVWIGAGDGVTQWERPTGKFHPRALPKELVADQEPSAFADDRRGGIWIGYFYSGGVARWRNGRLERLDPAAGAPGSRLNQIFCDRKGRIWIATTREGVARVDDPGADRPRFQWITTREGLGSDTAYCVAEDRWNRIYIGHGRGVDRLDPDTGKIRRFTNADGLVTGELTACYGATDGTLWFASHAGVSRLIPEPERQSAAPPVYLTGVYLRGVAQGLGFQGTGRGYLDLAPDQNQVQIDFAAVSFNELLRYQYKLEGSPGDWSEPANTRTVNFASLAAGPYKFLVRAVNAQELPGEPASISFTIAPPLWRRWWAETCAALALGLAIYGAHRYRVRYLLAIERVRTRIASDLHDDIGANLSQIAILSEIARRGGGPAPDGPLAKIAQVSRESLRSMSDIIWAIDPERDRLSELVQRMRRLAGDLLASSGIDLQFQAATREIELASDLRRQLFLIYKEALNNAARHSGATRVQVGVTIEDGALVIRVADNGRGFDPSGEYEGRGVANMRSRAQALHGALDIRSDLTGTIIELRAPAGGQYRKKPLHVRVATPD